MRGVSSNDDVDSGCSVAKKLGYDRGYVTWSSGGTNSRDVNRPLI